MVVLYKVRKVSLKPCQDIVGHQGSSGLDRSLELIKLFVYIGWGEIITVRKK